MKRFLFLWMFFSLYSNVSAQNKKIVSEKDKQIQTAIESISLLYALNDVCQNLYHYSFTWVYMPVYSEGKEVLRDHVTYQYPEIKKKLIIHAQGWQNPQQRILLDSLFMNIEQLIKLSAYSMKNLVRYEDYEGDIGLQGYSEKLDTAKGLLHNKMSPTFQLIEKQCNVLLSQRQDELKTLLEGRGRSEKKAKAISQTMNAVEMHRVYNYLTMLYSLRNYSWNLYNGTVHWVYISGIDYFKTELILWHARSQNRVNEFKETTYNHSNYFEQALVDSIIVEMNDISRISKELMGNLLTSEKYEDPINALTAQDAIESLIMIEYARLRERINSLIDIYEEKLYSFYHATYAKDAFNKNNDLKKMVYYYQDDFREFMEVFIADKNKELGKNILSIEYFDIKDLLSILITKYDKMFSHEEIKEIIQFQHTKAGRRIQESIILLPDFMPVINVYFSMWAERQLEVKKTD